MVPQIEEEHKDLTDDQIDALMDTAHEFDGVDEVKREFYGNLLSVPAGDASRCLLQRQKQGNSGYDF